MLPQVLELAVLHVVQEHEEVLADLFCMQMVSLIRNGYIYLLIPVPVVCVAPFPVTITSGKHELTHHCHFKLVFTQLLHIPSHSPQIFLTEL